MATHAWLRSYPDNLRWDAPIASRPLTALLDDAKRKYGKHRAIDFLGRHFTYDEVHEQALRMAASLRKMGVRRNVKVGLALPNCPQFVIGYFAVLYAGGTVVNFNPLYAGKELAHQIRDSGTEIMITLALNVTYPKIAERLKDTCLRHVIVSSLADALPLAKRLAFPLLKKGEIAEIPQDAKHHDWNALLEELPLRDLPPIHPDADVAVLQYTGGTTGIPKGVELTHANLYANAVQSGLWFTGMEAGKEKFICALPLFHVFAMTVAMNLAIQQGCEMILLPRFDLKQVLEDIDHKKATLMPGVSALFAAINNHPKLKKYDLKSLKFCISGGGPLAMEVKDRFEALTGCRLVEGYGLSEASPVTACGPLFGRNKKGSIGLPLPGTIMEVYDREDRDRKLPAGEVGEIVIRGPQVMHGYWQNVDESLNVLRRDEGGLRLHTGDVGYMDEEGYFYIVDRMKEMIISGGYNIYPRQVEEVLYRHPAIAECAVIGVPDEKRGEKVKAYVTLREGQVVDAPMLRSFCKEELPPYAVPSEVEFRAELPKTMVGKVDKKALKKL